MRPTLNTAIDLDFFVNFTISWQVLLAINSPQVEAAIEVNLHVNAIAQHQLASH